MLGQQVVLCLVQHCLIIELKLELQLVHVVVQAVRLWGQHANQALFIDLRHIFFPD